MLLNTLVCFQGKKNLHIFCNNKKGHMVPFSCLKNCKSHACKKKTMTNYKDLTLSLWPVGLNKGRRTSCTRFLCESTRDWRTSDSLPKIFLDSPDWTVPFLLQHLAINNNDYSYFCLSFGGINKVPLAVGDPAVLDRNGLISAPAQKTLLPEI